MNNQGMYMHKSSQEIMNEINSACFKKIIIVIIEAILAVVVFVTWSVCGSIDENDNSRELFYTCVFIYIIVAIMSHYPFQLNLHNN